MNNKVENRYSIHDFDKVWRIIPMNRHKKELIKNIIFTMFPFYFKNWSVYQNWKFSRPFCKNWYSFIQKEKIINSNHNIHFINNTTELKNKKVAFIIHIFYIEILKEILEMIKDLVDIDIKLFVTCPHKLRPEIELELQNFQFNYNILEVENRGRDVLPFIKIFPIVLSEDFEFVMKLHTKKSNHLKRNNNWRNDLYDKLLKPDNIKNFIEICNIYPDIGMIGPSGHILPMSLYYGGNSETVLNILKRIEIENQKLQGAVFIAGTMFFARTKALQYLLNIGISEEEFEIETGQVDGTLAHAMERVICIGVNLSSLRIIDSDSKPDYLKCEVTTNYTFTL